MSKTTRRRALALAATGLTGSLAGCANIAGELGGSQSSGDDAAAATTKRNETATTTAESTENATTSGESETTESPDVQIGEPDVFSSTVPTPSNPSNFKYATMGPGADAPTATVYGSWKCPYTQEFVRNQLPELVEEFVASGDAAVEFRSVAYENGDPFLGPDAPRASRAGLAAWNVDPDAYWQYFAYVFGNQPPERLEWAQRDVLTRFASEAGVESVDQFEDGFTGSAYQEAVQSAAARFEEIGAAAVPRVVAADEVTAPTVNPEATREQFRRLTENGN